MTLSSFSWYDQKIHDIDTTENYDGHTKEHGKTHEALLRVVALCSRAEFKSCQPMTPVLQRECSGDASEIALLKFSELTMGNVAEYRGKHPKVAEIPFNSTNKFHISVHKSDSREFFIQMYH